MGVVRHGHAAKNPVTNVERPAINRNEGATLAFESTGIIAVSMSRKCFDAAEFSDRDTGHCQQSTSGGTGPGRDCSQARQQLLEMVSEILGRFRVFDGPLDSAAYFILIGLWFGCFLHGILHGPIKLAPVRQRPSLSQEAPDARFCSMITGPGMQARPVRRSVSVVWFCGG